MYEISTYLLAEKNVRRKRSLRRSDVHVGDICSSCRLGVISLLFVLNIRFIRVLFHHQILYIYHGVIMVLKVSLMSGLN